MKRDFLQSFGLSDEAIDQVMAEYGKSVQGIKDKLTAAESQLTEANDTLANLKKANKDNEGLQNEVKAYKDKVAKLEREALATARKQSVKDALINAGATDVDYLLYKLGDIEVIEADKDGNLVDLDNKIKDLQTNYSGFFKMSEQGKDDSLAGYQYLGGADLKEGSVSKGGSIESVISNKELNLTKFLQENAKGDKK